MLILFWWKYSFNKLIHTTFCTWSRPQIFLTQGTAVSPCRRYGMWVLCRVGMWPGGFLHLQGLPLGVNSLLFPHRPCCVVVLTPSRWWALGVSLKPITRLLSIPPAAAPPCYSRLAVHVQGYWHSFLNQNIPSLSLQVPLNARLHSSNPNLCADLLDFQTGVPRLSDAIECPPDYIKLQEDFCVIAQKGGDGGV